MESSDNVEKEDLSLRVASNETNILILHNRVRAIEKKLDTKESALWKRILFRIDGWPPWYVLAKKPAWRPWRKWWTS